MTERVSQVGFTNSLNETKKIENSLNYKMLK